MYEGRQIKLAHGYDFMVDQSKRRGTLAMRLIEKGLDFAISH